MITKGFLILLILWLMNNYCSSSKISEWKEIIYNDTKLQLNIEFKNTEMELKNLYDIKKDQTTLLFNNDQILIKNNYNQESAQIKTIINTLERIKNETFIELAEIQNKIIKMFNNFKKKTFHLFENTKNHTYLNSNSIKYELDFIFNDVNEETNNIIKKVTNFIFNYNIKKCKDLIINTEYTVYPILMYYQETNLKLYSNVIETIKPILQQMPKEKIKKMNEFLSNWNTKFNPI